jgi:hypothetical protein
VSTSRSIDYERRKMRANLQPLPTLIAFSAMEDLAREAALRGTTAAALASHILEIIAADRLFSAILDS